jgi:hypothetical protein
MHRYHGVIVLIGHPSIAAANWWVFNVCVFSSGAQESHEILIELLRVSERQSVWRTFVHH